VTLTWSDVHTDNPAVTGYNVYYDQGGKALLVASVGKVTSFTDTGLTNGIAYSYKITSTDSTNESAFSNILTATPVNNTTTTYLNVPSLVTGQYQKVGGGKNATTTFVTTTTFTAGSGVVFRMQVKNVADGTPVAGATVNLAITGGQNVALTSAPTGADGFTEVTWTTSAPNRKGTGGTPPGTYIATVEGVTLTGAVWDGIRTSTTFVIQ
jgi:hypothetical protein